MFWSESAKGSEDFDYDHVHCTVTMQNSFKGTNLASAIIRPPIPPNPTPSLLPLISRSTSLTAPPPSQSLCHPEMEPPLNLDNHNDDEKPNLLYIYMYTPLKDEKSYMYVVLWGRRSWCRWLWKRKWWESSRSIKTIKHSRLSTSKCPDTFIKGQGILSTVFKFNFKDKVNAYYWLLNADLIIVPTSLYCFPLEGSGLFIQCLFVANSLSVSCQKICSIITHR